MKIKEPIIGACSYSDNPDIWFPEMGRGGGTNNPKREKKKAQEIKLALTICGSCDKREECLNEGMLPENINYGIWGGMLAAERLMKNGVRVSDYDRFTPQGFAFSLYYRLREHIGR